jgi:uncharacterized membrane protein YidH (DUF202 family)
MSRFTRMKKKSKRGPIFNSPNTLKSIAFILIVVFILLFVQNVILEDIFQQPDEWEGTLSITNSQIKSGVSVEIPAKTKVTFGSSEYLGVKTVNIDNAVIEVSGNYIILASGSSDTYNIGGKIIKVTIVSTNKNANTAILNFGESSSDSPQPFSGGSSTWIWISAGALFILIIIVLILILIAKKRKGNKPPGNQPYYQNPQQRPPTQPPQKQQQSNAYTGSGGIQYRGS